MATQATRHCEGSASGRPVTGEAPNGGVPNLVLLIHGLDDTEAVFHRLRADLQRQGWTVHCLNLVPNNGDAGLDVLARQIVQYVESNVEAEQCIDLVGFSMGGLVARYYIQRLGGMQRVRRLITISSPHNGTWNAFLRGNEGARQMRPGSGFLRDLNRDAEMLDCLDFTSIWTPFDLMILPARSSVMPVGRAVRVNVAAHPLMVRNSRVLRLVRDGLSADR